MTLLLDTHTFIWFVAGAPQLSAVALAAIADPMDDVLVSAATVWEMSIKYARHKLNITERPEVYIPRHLSANSFGLLNIELRHIFIAGSLPPYHGDPFDRMLIAQSLVEQVTIVSVDGQFDSYGVTRLW